jgi:hypothetical protein
MEPVPEIDLAELVEECRPIARIELARKIKLGRMWTAYWKQEAKQRSFEAKWKYKTRKGWI